MGHCTFEDYFAAMQAVVLSDVALIKAGAQVDGKSAFYASRSQLRAWPGEGGGGAAYDTGSLLFSVFGSRPLLRPVDN